jgi:hypothetical protein
MASGIGDTRLFALLDIVTTLLELLNITGGSGLGDLVWEQEVLREALSDIDDVSLSAFAPQLIQKDDFHGTLLFNEYFLPASRDCDHYGSTRRAQHGSRAITRARLIAFAIVMLMLHAGTRHTTGLNFARDR